MFFALVVLPAIVAFLVLNFIWMKLGKTRPFLAGFLTFVVGTAPLIIVAFAFGIDPWEPSYGAVLIGPTYGAAAFGIIFLLIGFGVGLFRNRSNLVQLAKDVRDGNHG